MYRSFVITLLTLLPRVSFAEAPTLFVSHANQISRLDDHNGDGDFLDEFESRLFAENFATTGTRIAATPDRVWVIETAIPRVMLLQDRNGDGDAMDFAEQLEYAVVQAPLPAATPALNSIAVTWGDILYVSDSINGLLFRIADTNHDGDALDVAETVVVATNLVAPTAIAVRPDDRILVLNDDGLAPVRILEDRNHDGDFLDFAENLSYAEVLVTATDLCALSSIRSWTSYPSTGDVSILFDANADNDVLDFNEIRLYAEGLVLPTHIAGDPASGDLFVNVAGNAGSIVRLRDANHDGDALDAAESLLVAANLPNIRGIAISRAQSDCPLGDASGDGIVNIDDVPAFAAALMQGETTLCPIDMNSDGRVDALDIPLFIGLIAP